MKGKLKQIQKNKKNNHKFTKSLVVTLLITGEVAFALPTGENIVTGNVEIIRDKNQLIIKNSDGSIIDWKNFDTYKDEIVKFLQENNDSRVLNRILDGKETFFDGLLSSNANVYLINTSGILFGKNAKIDTKSLVASSLDISNKDFLDKKDVFSGNNGTKVENQGLIVVKDGKLALIGNEIKNSGIIKSENGNILLAAGTKVVIQDLKNRAIAYEIQAPNGKVINLGDIIAKNGKIDIRGKNIKIGGIVSTEGKNITIGNKNETTDLNIEKNTTISSSSDDNNAGDILMWGDKATYSGNYSAKSNNANGGLIETSGKTIKINDDIKINTTSKNGKTGTWLIDPINVNITEGTSDTSKIVSGVIKGESTITNSTIVEGLKTSSITITTDGNGTNEEGKIDVNADIIANEGNSNDLKLISHADINIKGSTQNGTTTNRKIDMKNGALNLEVGKDLNISDAEISVGKQSTWNMHKYVDGNINNTPKVNFGGKLVKTSGDIIVKKADTISFSQINFDTDLFEQSKGTLTMNFPGDYEGTKSLGDYVIKFNKSNIKLGSNGNTGNIQINTRNHNYYANNKNVYFANDINVDGNGKFGINVGYLRLQNSEGIEFGKEGDLNITATNGANIDFIVDANKPNRYKFKDNVNLNFNADKSSVISIKDTSEGADGDISNLTLKTVTNKGEGKTEFLIYSGIIKANNIINEKGDFNFLGRSFDIENTDKNQNSINIQSGTTKIQVDSGSVISSIKIGGNVNVGQGSKLEMFVKDSKQKVGYANASEAIVLKNDLNVTNQGLFAISAQTLKSSLNMNNHNMTIDGGTNILDFTGYEGANKETILNAGTFDLKNGTTYMNAAAKNGYNATFKDINVDNSKLFLTTNNVYKETVTDTNYQDEVNKYINKEFRNNDDHKGNIVLGGNIKATNNSNVDIRVFNLKTSTTANITNEGANTNTLKLQAKTVDTSAGALTLDKWGTNDISVFDLNKGKTNAEFKVTGVEGDEVLFKVLDKTELGATNTADSTYGGRISVSNKDGTDTGIKIQATANNNLIVEGNYTNAGNITATSGKNVETTGTLNSSNGSITIKGEQGTTINGDITAKKDIILGEKQTTTINANNLKATEGTLKITGEQDININTNNTTNKTQTLKGANVTITSTNGDVNIGNATGSEDVKINSGLNQTTSGKVEILGKNVTLNQSTKIGNDSATNKDDIIVTANGTETDKGIANINAKIDGKNITITGEKKVVIGDVGSFDYVLNATENITLGQQDKGNVELNTKGKEIKAGKTLTIYNQDDLTINDVNLIAKDIAINGAKNINLGDGTATDTYLTTDNGNITITAGGDITSKSDLVLDKDSKHSNLSLKGKNITFEHTGSSVNDLTVKANEKFDINTNTTAYGDVNITANHVLTTKSIKATANTTSNKKGSITITGTGADNKIDLKDSITSDSFIKVNANTVNTVAITSNGKDTTTGGQDISVTGDTITIGGKVTASQGKVDIGTKTSNVTVNNQVEGNKTVTVQGDTITNNSLIESKSEDVLVDGKTVTSKGTITGNTDVVIKGANIEADGSRQIIATTGKVDILGTNTVSVGGRVTSKTTTTIGTDSTATTTVNGTVTAGTDAILKGDSVTTGQRATITATAGKVDILGKNSITTNGAINAGTTTTIGTDSTATTTINGAVSGNTGIDVLGSSITTKATTGTLTSNNGNINVGNDNTTTATIEGNITANTNTVTIKSNESTTVKNNTVTADTIKISSKKDVVLGDKYSNGNLSDGSDGMIDTKFIAKTTMEVKGSNSVDIYKDVEFKGEDTTSSTPSVNITSKTINSDGKITAGNITLTGEPNNDSTINLGGKVESKGDIKVSANDVTANGDIKTTTANETSLNGNITIVGTNSTNTTATISTDKGTINLGVDEKGTTSKTTTISGGIITGTDKVTIKANDSVTVNSGTISGKGVDISSTNGSVTLGDKQGTADTTIKSTDNNTPINVTAKTDLTINSDAKLGDDTTKSDITLKGSNITSEGTLDGKNINVGDETTNTTTISGGTITGEGKVSVKAKDDLTIKNTEVSSKQEVDVNANNVTIGDDSSNGVDTKITTTDSGVVNITGTNKVDIKKDSEINSSTNATINGGTLTNDGKITGTDNVKVTGNNVTSNREISSTQGNTTLFGKNSTTNTGTISGVSVVNIGSNGNEKSNSTTVSGNVTSSNGKVDITSTGTTEVKNAEVKGATEVSVTGKDITIGDGSDNVDTKISTTGTDGKVKVDGTGTIKVNKDTEITSSNTSVNGDNVTTDGKITGTNEVKVTGDNVTSNGTISSDKTTTLFGKNSTSVTGGSISGTNGVNIGTNGTDKSATTTVNGNITSTDGKVDITATNDVTVDNANVTGSGVNISSDKGNVNIGNGSEGTDTTITTTGKNEPDNNLTISAAGTTTINKDSNLTSAGNIALTGNDIKSNGEISSTNTTLFGKNSTSVTGGSISGTNGVNIGTDGNGKKSNSTTVSGNVTSSNGKVGITATNDVTVVDGTIKGEAGVDLTGANITVGNAKGDKDTIIDGGNGAINVKGDKTTINKDSNLTSKDDITLVGNSEVVVSGDIKTDKGIKVDSPNGTTTIKDANLTSNDLSLTANKDVVFENSTSTSKETTTIKSTTGNVTIGDNKGEKDTIINTGGNLDITSPKDITINSDSNLYSKKDINVDGKDVVVDGGKISADKDINLNTKVEGDNNVIVKDNNGNRGNITSNAQLTIGNGNTNLKLTHSDITSGVDNGFKTNLDKAKLDMDYDSTIDGSKKSIKSTFINFIDAVIDIKDKIFAKGIARQERVDYQGKYEIEDIEHKKSTKKITGKGSVKVEEITK